MQDLYHQQYHYGKNIYMCIIIIIIIMIIIIIIMELAFLFMLAYDYNVPTVTFFGAHNIVRIYIIMSCWMIVANDPTVA